MIKKKKMLGFGKSFCGVLLMSLILLLTLNGCDRGDEETPSSPKAAPITLFSEGSTDFTIVRGDSAVDDVVRAAADLRTAFIDKANVEISLCDEYKYSMGKQTPTIVVGVTSDEVSIRLRSELHYDDYLVYAENGNLYLLGGSDEATVNAVNYFIKTYLSETNGTLTLQGDLNLKYEHQYAVKDLSIVGNPISSYRIVYDKDLYYSKVRATELQTLIVEQSGVLLETVADTEAEETANEILVGVTNRSQSAEIANSFHAPNIYYRATVSGSKLVIVNEGVRSGEAVVKEIQAFFKTLTSAACDINASNFNISGDIKASTDKKALERVEGTDIRVVQSNVLLGVTTGNDNGYTDQQRAELLVDTYLIYSPDVITFNEMISDRNINKMIRKLLADYYTFADAEYLALFDDSASTDSNVQKRNYATPVAYRKDSGLTELKSGFNYLSDLISYHGLSWTVFETSEGDRFLVAAAHFSENKDADGKWITTFAADAVKIVNAARSEYGDLPVILCGDWYFWKDSAPYNYMISAGLADASEIAQIKHSVGIGTYHTIGIGTLDRVEEDICFINTQWLSALSHKVLVDFYTVNASDHYPILIDLQLRKSATSDDIDPFDDGTGHLNVKDEGAGGFDEWGTDAVPAN